MLNLPLEEEYQEVINKTKEILSTDLTLLASSKKNAEIGGGDDFIFLTYAYFTTELKIYIGVQNRITDTFDHISCINNEIEANMLLNESIKLVIKTFPNKNEEDLYNIVLKLCTSLKTSLNEYEAPSIQKEEVIEHHDLTLHITHIIDKYISLINKSQIKGLINTILSEKEYS